MFKNKLLHNDQMDLEILVAVFNQMVDDFLDKGVPIESGLAVEQEQWTPFLDGWLKANTDAAFKWGEVTLRLVVRNDLGDVILLSSKLLMCALALEVELQVIL